MLFRKEKYLKDVRANCLCAFLLPTQFMLQYHATSCVQCALGYTLLFARWPQNFCDRSFPLPVLSLLSKKQKNSYLEKFYFFLLFLLRSDRIFRRMRVCTTFNSPSVRLILREGMILAAEICSEINKISVIQSSPLILSACSNEDDFAVLDQIF